MKIASSLPETVPPAAPKERQAAASDTAKASGRAHSEASRQAFNRSILESSMEANLSVGNHSLALLFKSAIEHLNEVLAPELGADAIQRAYDAGLDVSPEATAGRIVGLSTGFFARYREQHPDKALETALHDFVEVIGRGIDRGFAEARQILDGLRVLEGEIAANIDKTYELVQEGLKAFVESYRQPGDETPAERTPSPEG